MRVWKGRNGGSDLFEHTADVGVVGWGDDLAEALACVAKGMLTVIADLDAVEPRGELEQKGIIAIAQVWASLAEEASIAYKNVQDVVRVSEEAGLSRNVVRLRPLGVIKG